MKLSLIVPTLLILSSTALNAATLSPKRGVSIYHINGEATESKISDSEIGQGLNQIVVRMDKNMSKGTKSDVFTSIPYVLTFTLDGNKVVVDHPVARSKVEAERAFNTPSPKWILVVDGEPVEYEMEMLEGKGGFLPYSGMDKLIQNHNADRGIYFENGQLLDKHVDVVLATTATVATVEVPKVDSQIKQAEMKVDDTQNLDQLKAWYQKASKSERKEFRRWMIDQE